MMQLYILYTDNDLKGQKKGLMIVVVGLVWFFFRVGGMSVINCRLGEEEG